MSQRVWNEKSFLLLRTKIWSFSTQILCTNYDVIVRMQVLPEQTCNLRGKLMFTCFAAKLTKNKKRFQDYLTTSLFILTNSQHWQRFHNSDLTSGHCMSKYGKFQKLGFLHGLKKVQGSFHLQYTFHSNHHSTAWHISSQSNVLRQLPMQIKIHWKCHHPDAISQAQAPVYGIWK